MRRSAPRSRRCPQRSLGVPLQYTDAEIAEIISPRHFVDVRRTLGGPAPSETSRAIDEARRTLETDRRWLTATRDAPGRGRRPAARTQPRSCEASESDQDSGLASVVNQSSC